jgi:CHAD domain-containing protein/CYTH domain-containing protein
MTPQHPRLSDLPVNQAVARIADGYLGDAASALTRVRDPDDEAALHNFRVAIRRLRSLLRAYQPWIGRAGSRKVRRRLRELTRLTGAGRDAEVQIAWLESQRKFLDRRERKGLNRLLRQLRGRKQQVYRAMQERVRRDFKRVAKRLHERIKAADTGERTGFRNACGSLLQPLGRELERRLAALTRAGDVRAAHQARIHVKRLRYLAEPLRPEMPEARVVIKSVKRLQDCLGQLHDMHVLEAELSGLVAGPAAGKAERLHAPAANHGKSSLANERHRDERRGLVSLLARVRRHRDQLFAELEQSWLRNRSRELIAQIEDLVAVTLHSGAAAEIERKYLLKSLPPRARKLRAQEIEQGWLPGKRLRERLRRVKDSSGERFYRTIKLGTGIRRLEIEEETTPGLFRALWPQTQGCRVRKRRYRIRTGTLIWEIDRFDDRDLVMAEVELPEAGVEVEPPKWLKAYVAREVTEDPAFQNLKLAR